MGLPVGIHKYYKKHKEMGKVNTKIAILGAGNGGFAFSGHLGLEGFEVRLYEDPKFAKNLTAVQSKGGIEVTGAKTGFGKVALASTDIASVLKGVNVIMVVVPAFAQMAIFESALPYLEDGQIVVFWPDNFGTILAKKLMKEKNVNKDIKLAGTASLLYSTRKVGTDTNKVHISAIKADLPIACLPASDNLEVIKYLKNIIPQMSEAKNALEIGLVNMNLVVHCSTSVLNAGWIEWTKGDFEFYWHGMTPSVCRVAEKIDEEKSMVAKALGINLNSALQYLNEMYPTERADTLYEFVSKSRAHGGRGPSAPKNLKERYISEDVPVGLVATSSLGRLCNVPTPTIDAIILLASILNNEDYRAKGRDLTVMGFDGMTKEEIINYVNI